MVKKVLKVITNIFTVFVFIMLAITIFAKINMVISGKSYFEIFGYSIFKITTGSMEPAINENDIIIVKNNADYSEKDIVTYVSDNAFITHRIVSINGDKVVTKGDANNTIDGEIEKSAIIGKVVKICPKLGIWQSILTTPKIIIAMFITLILFDVALSYKGNKKIDDIDKTFDEAAIKKDPKLKDALKEKLKEEKEDPYTVRLDLNKIQENINENINKKD